MTDKQDAGKPIILDVGKQKKRAIKALADGAGGKLSGEIAAAVAQARARLGPEAAGREVIPVIVVYEKRGKRKRRGGLLSQILGLS
jgi:hypothetical protein